LEAGPCEDPSGLQCEFDRFCWEFANLGISFQTQLAIDTHMTVRDTQTGVVNTQTVVTDTQTMVADTKTAVTDTQTMVADIHRRVLTGQEATSGQNKSVGQLAIHQHQNSYYCLDPVQVSDTEHHIDLQSYVSLASLLVKLLPRHRGTVSDVTSWLKRSLGSLKTSNPSLSLAQGASGRRPLLSQSSTTIGLKNDLATTADLSAATSFPLPALISSPDFPR
jgi:hypothetical protein